MNALRPPSAKPPRRGYLSMELALTLPILGIVLLALFEFTLLFYSRSQIVEASRTGARVASRPGVALSDVEQSIRDTLAPGLQRRMSVAVDLGESSGDVVSVVVSVPMAEASPDLLWPVGFSLAGRELVSETRMLRE